MALFTPAYAQPVSDAAGTGDAFGEENSAEHGSLDWLLQEAGVQCALSPRFEDAFSAPLPDAIEAGASIREMADCLSERANLRKRVEVVHNGGRTDPDDECAFTMRALWAVPFVLCVESLRTVERAVSGCCSSGVRARPERLVAGPGLDAGAQLPKSWLDHLDPAADTCGVSKPSTWCGNPNSAPPLALPSTEATRRDVPSNPTVDPGPALAAVPGAAPNQLDVAGAAGAAADVGFLGAGPGPDGIGALAAAPFPDQGEHQTGILPALEPSTEETDTLAPLPAPKPKRRGGGRSMVSLSSNMQSSAGALLAGSLNKPPKSKQGGSSSSSSPPADYSDAPDAQPDLNMHAEVPRLSIGGGVVAPSAADGAVAMDVAQEARSTPQEGNDESQAAPAPVPTAKKREKRPGEGKTVISNFQSTSAAGSLLAGLNQPKAKKRPGASKSAVG